MAVKLDTKGELKSSGLWTEFCAIREELKANGASPSEARDEALLKIEPQLEEWRQTTREPGGSATTAAAAGADTEGAPEPACCPGEGAPDSSAATAFSALTLEEREEFMAREADITEVCNWVAARLECAAGEVTILDAPCPQAWTLYANYSLNRARKLMFLKDWYSKLLPSHSNLDSGGTVVADGNHIVAAIDRLASMRAQAEGGGE